MLKRKYKVVVDSSFEGLNPDLFKDYWEFEDVSRLKYRYTTVSLRKKYKLNDKEYYKAIAGSGYLLFENEMTDCGKRYVDIKIYNRNELRYLINKSKHPDLFCEECFSIVFNKECEGLIDEFSDFLPLGGSVNYLEGQKELSYLEKIFLYNLLNKTEDLEKNYIVEGAWNSFKSLEALGMQDIVDSLFDKGYLYSKVCEKDKYFDLVNKQNIIKEMFYNGKVKYLRRDVLEILRVVYKLDLSSKLYFNIPLGNSNLESWVYSLHFEIMNSKVTVIDCKEIESYVYEKRLLEVYDLLDYYCDKEKIPVSKDNALEMELLRMINSYSFLQCNSILGYQAKQTAQSLYRAIVGRNSNFSFVKRHIYRKKISWFLDYLESKDEKPQAFIPPAWDWAASEIEIYISTYIIKNYEKWEKFTPKEIVENWLSNVSIDGDDI